MGLCKMNDDSMFDVETPKDANLVEQVREACAEAVDLARVIEGYEAASKAARIRLYDLQTKTIPEALSLAGMGDTFSLATGEMIQISDSVRNTIGAKDPERDDKLVRRMETLIRMGGEALVKTALSVSFAKGEYEEAEVARDTLISQGLEPELGETVNFQSLVGFVRERIRKGESVENEGLGLEVAPYAKITMPKK